jgi:ABC-type Fe3+-siderophore transport system permease subunit
MEARAAERSPARIVHAPLGAVYAGLIAAGLLACALALAVGHGDLSDPNLRDVFLRLRAQRLAGAFLAGSALSVAGVLVQGLFRNPLASPSVIGTSAGASLGGRVALLGTQWLLINGSLPWLRPELLIPIGCIGGALAALALLFAVAEVKDDLVVLLLTGFLLSSMFMSVEGFVTSLAQERWELSRAVLSFALGDVSGVGPRQLALAAPLVLIGIALAYSWSVPLDLMLTGEEEALSLGADVTLIRRWVVVWTSILTAAAVAIGGNVGFVGLVVPHALRPWVGITHRRLIPAAALGGGIFVVSCDVLCRVLPGRSEVPLGVVTGIVGAPTFLWLLLKHRRESYSF